MNKKRSQAPYLQHAGMWALLMVIFITELLLYTGLWKPDSVRSCCKTI